MDFYQIKERPGKRGSIEIYPDFVVCRSKDLMVRGKSFYAIWDEEKGLWSTDEFDVRNLVDKELLAYRDELAKKTDAVIIVKTMHDFSTKMWKEYRDYIGHLTDTAHQLDTKLTFQNTKVTKKDYVSRRLPYPLEEGECPAYDEIMSTIYDPNEREKLEWAIGSIISGDAKEIEKFIVLYGESGSGKSTFLKIVQRLFDGYYTTFDSKALTSSNNAFSLEAFRSNPLVAIQHDGDLSRIEDNTKLNSVTGHDIMRMNEKNKPTYDIRLNCFLFMASNKPVKITEAKSGIIRRLIDVRPSGRKIPNKRYHEVMAQIEFELGAIAYRCLKLYQEMGKNYYGTYRPLDMIYQTDVFFNFVEAYFNTFSEQNGTTLSQAYEMYKTYCDEALVEFKLPRHKFRDELKNYFQEFCDMTRVDGKQVRSYYNGFLKDKFSAGVKPIKEPESSIPSWLILDSEESLLDTVYANLPAQYSYDNGIPYGKWKDVTTKLSDLDTKRLHYVKAPPQDIFIDFDLVDDKGHKSVERNIEEAKKWPATYAEFSKSGSGLHLHYTYEGDINKLSYIYAEGIEVKVFNGDSALRRKLSKCNRIPIAKINSGLPLKGEDKVLNPEGIKSEKALRTLILRNLRKEIHPNTKPSVDFIYTILDEAYKSGMKYDVTDMRPSILAFANNSSHQSLICVKTVGKMKFQSDEPTPNVEAYKNDTLVFYDVEVFPNLFVVNWKYAGPDNKCVRMINPTPEEVGKLFELKLIGFNCRRYDNHMLYARYIGNDNEQLFILSQRIIGESKNAMFGDAYNISYTDVYDFAATKQSLKKWQIQLGLYHLELGLPWDKPVPEELWNKVAEYCDNDVISTEAVFNHLKADFVARQILADLSGLTVNDTTQMHTAKIIFGNDPRPQDKFIYTDLSTIFPGYKYEFGKSSYRGEDPGEGGYVYAEPGVYERVALLDVASMHPRSIELLNLFGPYTDNYSQLKQARIAIKHKDFDLARRLLGGKLSKYLTSPEESDALSYALKIVVNIVYGLTSATFPNKFKDPRNLDNIVAKRGALFMIDLKHAVQEKGYTVAHIKTDSIKIPNADQEIIDFVFEFGKQYGYEFEHEATYAKMFLANDAVYIAEYNEQGIITKGGKCAWEWTATGAQFAQPYVFKTLFSRDAIVFEDMCETKTVSTALYLDMNENLPDVSEYEKEYNERTKEVGNSGDHRKYNPKFKDLSDDELKEIISKGHDYHFIGRAGLFVPILPNRGGGILLREKDGKYYAATGSKGFRWLEADMVKNLHKEEDIDHNYYRKLVDEAMDDIRKYTDPELFRSMSRDAVVF